MAVNSAAQKVRNIRAVADAVAAMEVDYLISTQVIDPEDRNTELNTRSNGYISAIKTISDIIDTKVDTYVSDAARVNDVYLLLLTVLQHNTAFASYGNGFTDTKSDLFGLINLVASKTAVADIVASYAREHKGYQAVNVGGAKVGTNSTGLVAASGYQIVNVGGAKTDISTTSLVSGTTYTATVTVDGVAKALSILGSTAPTFRDLVTKINLVTMPAARAALVGGNIKITSASLGTSSTIAITAGTLFASPLAGFSSVASAVAGTQTTYTASVVIDGGSSQPISVGGASSQTFTDLIAQIQADVTGATVELYDGNIRITSNTSTTSSSVAITAGTLFASPLAGFTALGTAVAGQSQYPKTAQLVEALLLSNRTLANSPLVNALVS